MHINPYKIKKLDNNDTQQDFLLLRKQYIALYALIAVTWVVTYWVWADPKPRMLRYSYWERKVSAGELYRLLTVGFLHRGRLHLYSNMEGLVLFGLIVCYRTKMSNIKFSLFYLSAIIFAQYFAHQYGMSYLKKYNIKGAMGASGGTFSVAFAGYLLMFSPKKTKNSERKQILSILLFCYFFAEAYSSLILFRPNGVAHHMHFGGALYGTAFAFFFYPERIFAGLFGSSPPSSAEEV